MTTTYAYDAANRLTGHDEGGAATNYFFDANGNMTSEEEEHDTNRNFTWNRDDRMVQVSNEFAAGAPVVIYVYDAMGRRIVRKKGSEWRMFYYDGLSVAAEKKSTNSGGAWAWDRLYTLAPGVIGHVLAESQWSGSAWVSTFLHYDHIGNVTLSTNAGGQVVDAYDQDAFGKPIEGPNSGLYFHSKELDADAGLSYFYERWYESSLGRFLSVDPARSSEIIQNFFIYASNNPNANLDATGLFSCSIGPKHIIGQKTCVLSTSCDEYTPMGADRLDVDGLAKYYCQCKWRHSYIRTYHHLFMFKFYGRTVTCSECNYSFSFNIASGIDVDYKLTIGLTPILKPSYRENVPDAVTHGLSTAGVCNCPPPPGSCANILGGQPF